MNELTVTLSSQEAEQEFNSFVELKDRLTKELDLYKNIIVDEESYSVCKQDQKNLAGMRNRIDAFRKEEKKKMEEPIKAFEAQCKELMSVVQEAVDNLNSGTSVYDEKRREEKKEFALKTIQEMILNYNLSEKYAAQLVLKPAYLNLTATMKSVRADIATEAHKLQIMQEEEERQVQGIIDLVEKENRERNLLTGLNAKEFCKELLNGKAYEDVIKHILSRAEMQQKTEEAVRISEQKRAEEKAREAEIAAKKAAKEEAIEVQAEQDETALSNQEAVSQPLPVPPLPPLMGTQAAPPKNCESIWEVSLVVRADKNVLSGLCKFMKENRIDYDVVEQKRT